MKKVRYIAALLICLATAAFAQTPGYIDSAFHYKYPQVTRDKEECSLVGCTYVFRYQGGKKVAYFDENGNWLRTESYMDGQYIPDTVKASISNSRYNGWEIGDARLIETPSTKVYVIGLDDKTDITGLGGYHYLYCTSSGNCWDK
ncbi:MAG TPA: PepSY-like domain-containing protein [Bacteroidia bacterium]|jgi:hypothetical protein|nr:PepSY-like domain-containing protein [Bacteroidia bacterium]